MRFCNTRRQAAFTLIELSIVLVIVGLLVGGILIGQNLIKAAELNSVVVEFRKFQSAVNTFSDKYNALPGDFKNATDFWGAPGGNLANCPNTAGTGTETCNGDNNGLITFDNGPAKYNEAFTFWQHLANAGLIDGSYTGISGPNAAIHAIIETNAPKSKFNGGGWTSRVIPISFTGSTSAFNTKYGNTFDFGTQTSNDSTQEPIMTPKELWQIDSKIDDGMPGTGTVVAHHWSLCTLAANKDDIYANYKLSEEDITCAIFFTGLF